eukprot:gb/GEZN01011337.1/.p2 GENE.gb/GEZN01011337.1/~~gb/GEZN01011337.1/.p2  ORF type:complete len:103 (+),score=5.15 gb/GEZN01011337.1/:600-908(+)
MFFHYVQHLGERIGLAVNLTKCHVLMGKNQTQNQPYIRFSLPSTIKIETEGIKLGGAPIGSPTFCTEFAEKANKKVAHNLELIKPLTAQYQLKIIRRVIVPT